MKTQSAKPVPAAAKKQRHKKHAAAPASNATQNVKSGAQKRRVLAQHYRAKYGVK